QEKEFYLDGAMSVAPSVPAPGLVRAVLFPIKCGFDDDVEVIMLRLPIQDLADALGFGGKTRRIPRTTVNELDLKIDASDSLHPIQNLFHTEAMAIATVQNFGLSSSLKVLKRFNMVIGQ